MNQQTKGTLRPTLERGRGRLAEERGQLAQEGGQLAGLRGLMADQRGTATIEYLILLVCVTIGVAFALIEMGPAVVEVFRARALWISMPFP